MPEQEQPKEPEKQTPVEEKPIVEKPIPVAKPGLNKVLIIAIAVVGILIIGMIVYFVFRGPAEEQIPTELPTIEEEIPEELPAELPTIAEYEILRETIQIPEQEQFPIVIRDLQLVSSIDDNYNYVPRESLEYTLGDIILIYHEIANIKSVATDQGYEIGLFEGVELTDPDGNTIDWVYDENSVLTTKPVDAEEYYSIKIKSQIDTSRLNKTGTYTYIVSASNLNVDEPAAEEQITFTIR